MVDSIQSGRWYAKKVSRSALMIGSWASGAIRLRRALASGDVRVITYHRFGDWPRDPFCVSALDFEQQVRWAAEQGLGISLADLQLYLRGHKSLKPGSVLFTSDDGVKSVRTVAAPILRNYAVPMVAYVTTDAVGTETSHLGLPESFMTWKDIGELSDHGMTIGSHGHTHRSLGTMSEAEVVREAELSRDIIARELGEKPTSFAYPYGTPAHYSAMTRRVLASAGYSTILTSTHGNVTPDSDPLALRRVKVEGGEPLWLFKLLTLGAMDGWSLVDSTLSRIEEVKRRRRSVESTEAQG